MAAQGGILFQEKVSRLLGRQNGKPVLKPNRPLVLQDTVANRKPKKGEATCFKEMMQLMACWKENSFVDSLCSNETKDFYACFETARAAAKNNSAEQTSIKGGRLPSKQAITLLKRYPTLRSDI